MVTKDGFLRGENGAYVELLLYWLSPSEALSFKNELDSQLKRRRLRRLPGDSKVIRAVERTRKKLFPELTLTLLPNGLRLDSFGPRGLLWRSGEEFKGLLTREKGAREDYLLSRLAYGGESGEPGIEVRYGERPSRFGRVRSVYLWGMKVVTPHGVRSLRWERIVAVRILMGAERNPPRRLEFLSVGGVVQSTWSYNFYGGEDPLELYR